MTMSEKYDDLQILKRFNNGDISAFEELVLKYQDRIYNLCRHMLGNTHDAEDAAQVTFLKAYQNLTKFKSEFSLYTWLYRIAVNTCLDYKKRPFFESFFKNADEGEAFIDEPASDCPSPEKLYESKQIGLALHNSIKHLPSKLRAAIILKEIEGLSYKEIADILEVSIGTVKSRISRARDEMKISMKKFTEQK
jgi:RNA polymerase sigma-70 factor, ECF subfamily